MQAEQLFERTQKEKISRILFAQIPVDLDLASIQQNVEQLLHANWIDHVNRNHYTGGWDVLPLRCQTQFVEAHPVLQSFSIAVGEEWENLPALKQSPSLLSLLNNLPCSVKSARLMRLKAGAQIKPHRDEGLAIEFGEARLHMPIHTSNKVSFLVDNETIPMRAGELWYFNAHRVHEVYNRGDEDRINLVIDCVANDWLRKMIIGDGGE